MAGVICESILNIIVSACMKKKKKKKTEIAFAGFKIYFIFQTKRRHKTTKKYMYKHLNQPLSRKFKNYTAGLYVKLFFLHLTH